MSSYIGPRASDVPVGTIGTQTVSANSIVVGSNVIVNSSAVFVGNSTVNAVTNSSAVYISGNAVSPFQGMKNVIINGGMDIWQRGTSQTSSGYGSVDRWYHINAGTTTISQDTSVPAGVPVQYSVKWLTGASSSYGQSFQPIERLNVIKLRGQRVTVSCYIKTSSWTGNIILRIPYSNSTDAQSSYMSAASISDNPVAASTMTSWTRITNTFTVPSDAVGLGVYILPDTVQSSGAAVWITGVQLEVGSVATPFENRSYGLELQLCQRYYQKYTDGSLYGNWGNGSGYSICSGALAVVMRATPTYAVSGISTGSLYGGAVTASSFNIQFSGVGGGAAPGFTLTATAEL